MQLKDTTRTTRVGDISTAVGTAGHWLIYTGSAPSKTAAPTGTLLATFALSNPMGSASAAVLTITNPSSVTGAASGTPGYGRIIDGSVDDGTHTQVQHTCGVGSGELNFSSTVASGGSVSITPSATITEGNP